MKIANCKLKIANLRKGFTLVEILIAVTIIIVVGVVAFTTFRGGTAAWQQGTAHAQRNAGARATLEMMARELSKAILVAADGAYQIDFVGAASTIYFIGSLETPRPGQPDLVKVRYDLSADLGGGRRNLRRTSAFIRRGEAIDNFPATAIPHTLASDITGLTFEFFDAQPHFGFTEPHPRWRNTWDSRRTILADPEVTTQDPATVGTLPDAVRITLTSDPEGPGRGLPEKVFSIVTELPRAAPQPFSFAISLNPSSGSVVQGGSVTSTVRVELTGGTPETVTLSVHNLPAGVIPTFSLPPGTPAGTPNSGSPTFNRTLTLPTTGGATPTPTGTYTIEIRGTTLGGLSESAFYTLTVYSPFDFSLSLSHGAVSVGRPTIALPGHSDPSVTVTATLDPVHAKPREVTFRLEDTAGNPWSLTGTTAIILPSAGRPTFSALLTIDISNTTPLGNHLIRIRATEITEPGAPVGVSKWVDFSLRVFNFSLAVGSISSGQGGSQTTTVTATLDPGPPASGIPASVTTGTVTDPLPTGVTITGHGSITPNGSLPLTVATNQGGVATPLGDHIIEIGAIGGGITRTTTLTLSVFDCTLSVNPLTILRGAPAVNHPVTATLAAGPPASGTPASVATSHTVISGPTPTSDLARIIVGNHGSITPGFAPTPGSRDLTVRAISTADLGNYTIRITARCNGNSTVHEATFILTVANSPPTASFTWAPNIPLINQTINFDASASSDPDGSITTYRWDWTNDGIYDLNTATATATHQYTTAGTRTVKLTVVDNNGATASTTRNITVNAPPTASFTWAPNIPLINQTINFDASASSDPAPGSITTYRWDWTNDGIYDLNTATATATHQYTTAGTRTVKLTVVDNLGATASTTRNITVNAPPTASFTFLPNPAAVRPATPLTVDTITFDASASSDPAPGSITTYRWDWTNDGIYDLNTATATATHQYTTAGTRTVKLTVVDNHGATASTTSNITVSDVPTGWWHRRWYDWAVGDAPVYEGVINSKFLGETRGTQNADHAPYVGPIHRAGEFDHHWTWGVQNWLPATPEDSAQPPGSWTNYPHWTKTDRIQFWSIRRINFAAAGNWTFKLASDDGSKLCINIGGTWVNVISWWHPQSHTWRSESIDLPVAGYYTVRILYFENTGGQRLSFRFWRNVTVFTENFEFDDALPDDTSMGSWTVGDTRTATPPGLDFWGISTVRRHAGTRSAWCAHSGRRGTSPLTYDNDMNAHMKRSVNLAGLNSVRLTFRLWSAIDRTQYHEDDFFEVWHRVGTTTWTRVYSTNSDFLWTEITLNIPDNADMIRFNFVSGSAHVREGVYIDDVAMTAFQE